MKIFSLIDLTKWLFRALTKGVLKMAKEDVVAAAVTAIQAGEQQVLVDQLGAVYEKAQSEMPAPTGGVDQSVVDGLNKQIADLTAQDATDLQAIADAKSQGDQAVADIKSQLDAALAAKTADEKTIEGLKDSADKLQAAVDLIHSLFPAPAPVAP